MTKGINITGAGDRVDRAMRTFLPCQYLEAA